LILINLIFFAFNLDLAASRIFIGIAQGQHGSYTELSTVSVSKIGQPASMLHLCRQRLQRYAESAAKMLHNRAKLTGLAKEPALDSHRPKTAGESVDSLLRSH